jgi:hypothetical protein
MQLRKMFLPFCSKISDLKQVYCTLNAAYLLEIVQYEKPDVAAM